MGASISTPGKPHHSTLEENCDDAENVESDKSKENVEANKNKENNVEEDDEEIVIRRNKTPLSSRKKLRRLTIETPEVDLERLRPKKFNLDATNPLVSSPSHWAAGSEPNFESQPTQDTNNQSGTKRKKPGDFEPDFALQG